jgi:hypothetical protein
MGEVLKEGIPPTMMKSKDSAIKRQMQSDFNTVLEETNHHPIHCS